MTTNANDADINPDAEWVDRIIDVLQEFRKYNPDVTANQMLMFLNIAKSQGLKQVELSQILGMHDATVSRICAVLSAKGIRGNPGQDLIQTKTATGDLRTTAQVLSMKGRKVFNTLRMIMKGRE